MPMTKFESAIIIFLFYDLVVNLKKKVSKVLFSAHMLVWLASCAHTCRDVPALDCNHGNNHAHQLHRHQPIFMN